MARSKQMYLVTGLQEKIEHISEQCTHLDDWVKLIQNSQVEGDVNTNDTFSTLSCCIRSLAQLSVTLNAYGRLRKQTKELDELMAKRERQLAAAGLKG